MATEKDLDWLDDYLSNRMEGKNKAAFEEKMKADASLRSEMAIQRELIEGIRRARVNGLKNMLNNTPVPASGLSSGASKIAAWVAVAVAAAIGAYVVFDTTQNEPAEQNAPVATEQPSVIAPAEEPAAEAAEIPSDNSAQETTPAPAVSKPERQLTPSATTPKETTDASTRDDKESPAKLPSVTPFDPTRELETNTAKPEVDGLAADAEAVVSTIDVETDDSNRRYDFHYRFESGKLFLMGSFEKDLYEIMEFFNDNKRTVFLFYNDQYYLLDENQEKPAPLQAITDPTLLRKLRAYRDKE